jgi:hypothetical protein
MNEDNRIKKPNIDTDIIAVHPWSGKMGNPMQTDYKLTEEDRKLLTEFLGEMIHVIKYAHSTGEPHKCSCGDSSFHYQHIIEHEGFNRTFTTPSDQHAVFTKLVEVGKWRKFYSYCVGIWEDLPESILAQYDNADCCEWFWIEPERFCKLASLYLEEGKCQNQ